MIINPKYLIIMKRIAILALGAFVSICAAAQPVPQALKDAEKAVKGAKTPEQVDKAIQPAIEDPACSKLAQTYYVPGKQLYKMYDDAIGHQQVFGNVPAELAPLMPMMVFKGFDYYMQALPLDTVIEVDKKGVEKVKAKYSKEMIGSMVGHLNDYNNMAIQCFNEGDYANAFHGWKIYATLAENPTFADAMDKMMPADSTLAPIIYNQGLAAWQLQDFENAYKCWLHAIQKGYGDKETYDLALAAADRWGNNQAVIEMAAIADQAFPSDFNYIGIIINQYLRDKNYDKAIQVIDQALAKNPQESQYYVIKGVIFEQQEKMDEAQDLYKKAYDLNPENQSAVSRLGFVTFQKAYNAYNDAPADEAEFAKAFATTLKPMLLEAVPLLEKAYSLDNNDMYSLRNLATCYYLLNDEANYKRVNSILGGE